MKQGCLISMEIMIPESLYVALVAKAQQSGMSLDDVVTEAIAKLLKEEE